MKTVLNRYMIFEGKQKKTQVCSQWHIFYDRQKLVTAKRPIDYKSDK